MSLAQSNRSYDQQARKRSVRRGRETGCWVYIAGELLGKGGYQHGDPPPWYRIGGGQRGRYIVTTYREA